MCSSKLSVSVIASFLLFFAVGCIEGEQGIENAILNDRNSYFYEDPDHFPDNKADLPIGVFDSGTGGLAVLNDIVEYRCFDHHGGYQVFKNESFIYLADMANMPYGSYAMEGNTELLQEHILKNVQFLIDRKYYQGPEETGYMSDKSPVKAIIVGCTHYPFVVATFEKYLSLLRDYRENGEYIYREHMAEEITLINPAFKVARELYNTLSEMDLTAGNNYRDSEFYISVPNILNNQVELINDLNFTYEYKYGRKPGASSGTGSRSI